MTPQDISRLPVRLDGAGQKHPDLGLSCKAAIFLSDAAESELRHLRGITGLLKPPVTSWLIFHPREKSTSAKWVTMARQFLEGSNPPSRIGAGTNAYFAELNRGGPVTRQMYGARSSNRV